MKKRIILNESQVKAVLETGRLVVRRVVKPQPEANTECPYHVGEGRNKKARVNPLGNIGDQMWVGETWSEEQIIMGWAMRPVYKADGIDCEMAWKSPVTMSHKSSRLTLEIKSVRIERGDQWEWVYELKRVK